MEIILSNDPKEEISTLLEVLDFKPDCGMVRIEDDNGHRLIGPSISLEEMLTELFKGIIKVEREACAQIADDLANERARQCNNPELSTDENQELATQGSAALVIAKRIRERK